MNGSTRRTCFISYAREDVQFVRRLDAALAARGMETWVDYARVETASPWRDEIRRGIESSHVFVSILSPELVASDSCREELNHAIAVNNRIVPIELRSVDGIELPHALASPNWIIPDGEPPDLDAICAQIQRVLERDPEHVAEHTRLMVRAADWQRGGRERSALLRGRELTAAERWLGGSGEPAPTALHREYVVASRRSASRGQRVLLLGLGVALAVMSGLAVAAIWQRDEARRLGNESESRRLAGIADDLVTRDVKLAERIALTAERRAATPEAEVALRRTVASDDARWTARPPGGIRSVAWRPARPGGLSAAIAAVDVHGRITLLRPATGRSFARLPAAPTGLALSLLWADGGRRIVVAGTKGLFVWDATRPGAAPVRLTDHDVAVRVSGDGSRLLLADFFGRLVVRDADDYRVVGRLTAEGTTGADIAISQDGSRVAWIDRSQPVDLHRPGAPVRVWIPASGRQLTLAGRLDTLVGYTRLAYPRPHLTGCIAGTLVAWPRRRPRPRRVTTGTGCARVALLALSPSQTAFAAGGETGVVDVVESRGSPFDVTMQHIATGASPFAAIDVTDPSYPAQALQTARLAVAGSDGSVWRYAQGADKRRLAVFDAGVLTLAWAPLHDALLAVDGTGRAWMWGWGPRRSVADETPELVLSHDGRMVATAAHRRIVLRDARTLRPLASLQSRMSPSTFVGRGDALLAEQEVGPYGELRLWIVTRGRQRRLPGVYQSYLVAGDRPVMVGLRRGRVWLTDFGGAQVRRRRLPVSNQSTLAGIDPRGRWVALASWTERGIRTTTVDLRTGVRRSVPHALNVRFSPDGRLLAVVGTNGRSVRVLDLLSRRVIRRFAHFGPLGDVVWSHDGRSLLAIGSPNRFNGGTFVALHLDGPVDRTSFDQEGPYATPRYSLDDRLVIAGRAGSTPGIDVWDARTGSLVASWAHDANGVDTAISPDGHGILAIGRTELGDPTLDLLPCLACSDLAAVVAAAERRSAARTLTPEERTRYRLPVS